MKGCELCPGTARTYCESDQASLCFDCDAKVHGANFLVARHSRSLLCRSCQSPTPWKAAGPRLGPAFSVCDRCFSARSAAAAASGSGDEEVEGKSGVRDILEEDDNGDDDRDIDDEFGDEEEDDDDEDDDLDSEEEDEEEGEEQVVPWTAEPPPVSSSSSSEDEESVGRIGNGLSLKKRRVDINVDLTSSCSQQDQLPCSSNSRPRHTPNPADSARIMEDDEADSNPFRPLKGPKRADLTRCGSNQPPANRVAFGSGRRPI